MAQNRLDRDTILNRALNMADSPALDAKDRPVGTIVSTALSIAWLQECLDYFIKKFPFSSDLKTSPVSLATGATSFPIPSDFLLDYNNGIVLDDNLGRLTRHGLGTILNRSTSSTGKPTIYAVRGTTILIWPKIDKAYTGTLYYYYLPIALDATTVPLFPDDMILTDYVWLKAQEWHRAVSVGSARKYADDAIAELQRSGIGPESEEDALGLDPGFARVTADPTSWMGNPNL